MPSRFMYRILDPRRDFLDATEKSFFTEEKIALEDYIKRNIHENIIGVIGIEDTHLGTTNYYHYSYIKCRISIEFKKITETEYWQHLKSQGIIKPNSIFTYTNYQKKCFKFEKSELGLNMFIDDQLLLTLPETECLEILDGLLDMYNFPITRKILKAELSGAI